MSEEFLDFQVGASTTDSAIIRSAGLRCWVVIDGRKLDVMSIQMQATINGLPRANFSIALGTPAEFQRGGGHVTKLFRRFTPVSLWAAVGTPEGGLAGIRGTIRPGSYLVLDGVVESTTPAREGRSSVSFDVTIQHKFSQLLSANSLYGPFLPNDLQDVGVIFSGVFAAQTGLGLTLRNNVDLWQTISAGVTTILDASKTLDSKFSTDVPKSLLDRSNKQALELLPKVKSLLRLYLSDEIILSKIGEVIAQACMYSLSRRPNLWGLLQDMANEFGFFLSPTSNGLTVFPAYPFEHRAQTKIAPPGSAFILKHTEGESGSGDFSQVVGTILFGPGNGLIVHGQTPAELANVAAFFLKEDLFDPNFSVGEALRLPTWMHPSLFTISNEGRGYMPYAQARVRLACSPQGSTAVADGTGATAVKQAAARVKEPARRYGRFNTFSKLFGSNSLMIEMGLRFDLVPGQCLAVEVSNSSGAIIKAYGMINSMRLSFDASAQGASTIVDLAYVRSEEDQTQIVEAQDATHYCLESRALEVAKLVWSEAQ